MVGRLLVSVAQLLTVTYRPSWTFYIYPVPKARSAIMRTTAKNRGDNVVVNKPNWWYFILFFT
ncbi:hypothetical protein BH18THE2_BH18THE2_22050 [soil metagenome]